MGFALSNLQVSSTAFLHGGRIPARYTGEGEDVSPELRWHDVPEGTRAFAVICHDPDAPLVAANGTYGYVHWVLYNIPASVTQLPENCQQYTSGIGDSGRPGYGGPMPPKGHGIHHYYFWVLALEDAVELPAGLTMMQLLEKIEPRVIGMNRLVGVYQRG
jgi:Raf kinase inhibitor-like YbhB/YbcL family protein